MLDESYIYTLVDRRTNTIFYVGKTNNLVRRYNRYIRYRPHSDKLAKAIGEMKRSGIFPIMRVLEETTIYKENREEMKWIRTLYMAGHPLLNTTCIKNWKNDPEVS